MITVLWVVGCTREPVSYRPKGDIVAPPAESGATGSTGQTGQTGDTGEPEVLVDCSGLIAREDLTWSASSAIVTEEDFDFDGLGNLLTQFGNDLQGIDRFGDSHFVAANVGPDATGIRSTAEGFVALAQPSDGTVRLIDPMTGGSRTLLSNVSYPNGIEAGGDGMIYVTENDSSGRVRMVEPTTGQVEVIVQAQYANGIALSPDDQILYIASSTSTFFGETRIVALRRDDLGFWDSESLEVIYTHPDYVGSLTMDACGHLYGLEYSRGRVFRIDTNTGEVEQIIDFGQGGSWSALHFSPGLGGWQVDSLYVTNRDQLFEVPTGVPGSHVLTP